MKRIQIKFFHKHTDMENVEMNEEGTIEKLQYHVDEIDENEGSKLPNWKSAPEENSSKVNDDTSQVDMGRKT